MNDQNIINQIRQLLDNAYHAGPEMKEQYLSQARSLAHQISDSGIKYTYLGMIDSA